MLGLLTSTSMYASAATHPNANHAIPPHLHLLGGYEQKKLGQKRRGTTVDLPRGAK